MTTHVYLIEDHTGLIRAMMNSLALDRASLMSNWQSAIGNRQYDGGIVPDPEGIITGGQDNKTGRSGAVYQGDQVNAHALTDIFKQIAANNRAGGWRKLKRADRAG